MPRFMDLTGKRFGKLTVIERAERKSGKNRWKCLCDCGKYTYTITNRLVQGKTLSCGCRAHEHDRKAYKVEYPRLYGIWSGMKKRCNDKNSKSFQRYGGRGIKVCDEWNNSFPIFLKWSLENGYSEDLSIDRIDNDKGYCPENCRWATFLEQANNKRNTIFIEHDGINKTLSGWCKEFDFPYKSALQRYRNMIKKDGKINFEKLFYVGNITIKRIYQYDKSGNLVKVWNGTKELKQSEFDRSRVSACCNEKIQSYKDYIWSYHKF